MRPHSLVRRLLLQLIAAQVGLVVVALAVFPFVSPYVTYANIADRAVRELLTTSLHRGADGKLVLDPSPALRRYMARCVSAWNRDPVGGVIGVQTGPL